MIHFLGLNLLNYKCILLSNQCKENIFNLNKNISKDIKKEI